MYPLHLHKLSWKKKKKKKKKLALFKVVIATMGQGSWALISSQRPMSKSMQCCHLLF